MPHAVLTRLTWSASALAKTLDSAASFNSGPGGASLMLQSLFGCFPLAEVGSHQRFPEFAMVGDAEVQEFMHNHIVPEGWIER